MAKPIFRPEYDAVRALLRTLRLQAGVKQAELSKALGKPQPYISAIETGHRRVDIVEIRDICAALGTSLERFVAALEETLRKPVRRVQPKRTRVK